MIHVKITGRAGIIYYENNNFTEIDSEMLNGKFDMVIYVNSILNWNRDPAKPLTANEKARVIENLKTHMERKGISVDWQ